MHLSRYLLLLFCIVSLNVSAQEQKSFSPLQRLGASFGLTEPELLPPEQAFKLVIKVRDANTLVAEFTPAKDYYIYRDKTAFKLQNAAGISITKVVLPNGEIKNDPTFGKTEVYHKPFQAIISLQRDKSSANKLTLAATYQGCNEPIGVCYPPIDNSFELALPLINAVAEGLSPSAAAAPAFNAPTDQSTPSPVQIPAIQTESAQIDALFASGNFWLILISFFGLGLLLSFTPCVFPMFPILSGIIVGHGQHLTKIRGFVLAFAYVMGMALTYAAAGVAAGLSGAMLSAALQNAWVLGGFALVFVALAFSMFGFYEIQLPGSLQSKLSAEAGHFKGGHLTGVFGMGALSAVIVGPCVAAPLAGALLYISQTRDVVLGGTALFVMALGMGVPLLLLGASAGAWLPKAGAWMEAVKRFFGVLLLGVAIWLISPVISAVAHMLMWAALLIVSAIYLHAIDPLPPGASGFHKFFKGVGVIALLTGVILLVGVLSGGRDILQPLSSLRNSGVVEGQGKSTTGQIAHLPFQRVRNLAELEQRISQSQGKYVMLDFYADWCISCKEMERFTFADPKVQARLKDVVLLQADVTASTPEDAALLKRFKLFGPPGILFFDRQGREIPGVKVIGYQNAEGFLAVLNAVLI